MSVQFHKASRAQAKARIAIDGPAGSGKTYTALAAASSLGKRVAVIDTERGSASLYADKFEFDTCTLENFSPSEYVAAIHTAENAGYDVIVIDSLSHAWSGKGGALEMVDAAAARSKSNNSYAAWREVTPEHNALVDAMLQSPCHIVATMRTKTEYVLETSDQGKQVPRKVGMAPIQRDGMEYEFTVVGDMDLQHRFVVSKSRMDSIADVVVTKPGTAFFDKIAAWLNEGTAAPAPQPVSIPTAAIHAPQTSHIVTRPPTTPKAAPGATDDDSDTPFLPPTVIANSQEDMAMPEEGYPATVGFTNDNPTDEEGNPVPTEADRMAKKIPGSPATEKTLKLLYVLTKKAHWSPGQAKEYMMQEFGAVSSEELTQPEASAMIKFLKPLAGE